MDNKKQQEKYDLQSNDFEFVQQDEKIYDQKFETKPIGYFKDAMIRFGKNRTNVYATIILFTLIAFSVLVPTLTTKNFTRQENQLSYLPPRVPLFEKIGIWDGTKDYIEVPIDPSTINEETGLGYPKGFDPQFIVEGSLENQVVSCNDSTPDCEDGTNVFRLRGVSTTAALKSAYQSNLEEQLNYKSEDPNEQFIPKYENIVYDFTNFGGNFKPTIEIDIESFTGEETVVHVLLSTSKPPLDEDGKPKQIDLADYHVITTISEAGVHEIDVIEDVFNHDAFEGKILFSSVLVFQIENPTTNGAVEFNSISLNLSEYGDEQTYSGHDLSQFRTVNSKTGFYTRADGTRIQSSFTYKPYDAAFFEKELTLEPKDFDKLIADNADVCQKIDSSNDPDAFGHGNPNAWEYEDGLGCPVKRVLNSRAGYVEKDDGTPFYDIRVVVDYKIYSGYEDIPYFLFGTNKAGQDYFALVWLGLRTSLFVGIIVSTINISIGIVYGSIEGYYGGRVDLLMERFGEIVGRIPFLVWLALFVILLGPGILTLIILLTVTGWLRVSGVTRTQFYRYKGREYVLASRTLGAKDSRIIFRHILPNGIGTIITASVLMIPGVIFTESTVSYLGYGIGYGQDFNLFGLIKFSGLSIGVLLSEGRTQLLERPYLLLYPALIISILMITFNMFGNALRDAFNPSLRGSEE